MSSSFDGTCKLWGSGDWKLIATLNDHEGKVMSCDVSGDGTCIVSGSMDKTFKLWSNETDRQFILREQ
ncbi:hypothetical protein ROZALSC1DRAFT_31421 [Rozella allomycis CSF55]|uniref:WD40 repeat-like protein n=1 Tax=Rozella allomycis (strain CSF55) TaxID=988480 RepID=A0A4P9YCF8_ROZAC|nr:hypothetical protein ROZALSC1DRAFT_31421 [Rozella allomycis CSF55]